MPRYYFHLKARVPVEDSTGIELPDTAAARAEAIRFAGELSKVYRRMEGYDARGDVVVTDDLGQEVLSMLLPAAKPMGSRTLGTRVGETGSLRRRRAGTRSSRAKPARRPRASREADPEPAGPLPG